MSRKDTRTPVLQNIYKIGFASSSNFIPFLSKGTNFESAKQNPLRIFNALLHAGLIKEVEVSNRIFNRQCLRDTFYTLTKAGLDALDVKDKRVRDKISITRVMHESGLNSILLGFIYAFPEPEYKVEIERNYKFIGADARVVIHHNDKAYYFLIEFERSRSWEAIREEKLLALNNSKTKVIIVYAHEEFNVLRSPVEWNESILSFQQRHFKNFKHYTKDLKNLFLFMSYPDYTRPNETVFRDIFNSPRKLINN